MEGSTPPVQEVPPVAPDDAGGTKRKRGPHPDAGKYVVLMSQIPQTEGEASSFVLATSEAIPADGAREAKKKAVEANAHLRDLIAGEGVILVAVPAMSWQPSKVKSEQPPPIMRGL